MKSGRIVLLDLLVYLIVHGYLLAINNLFHSLAVGGLAGNLGLNSYSLEVVLLLNSQSDQALRNLADLLCSRLGGNDSAVVQQSGYLVSD